MANSDLNSSLNQNQLSIVDLADCMLVPPNVMTVSYTKKCLRSSQLLRNVVLSPVGFPFNYDPPENVSVALDQIERGIDENDPRSEGFQQNQEWMRFVSFASRNNVMDSIEAIGNFTSRAKSLGFAPPDNPFVEIERLNINRSIGESIPSLNNKLADDIIFSIKKYLDLIDAELNGEISLNRQDDIQSQLSHFSFDTKGFISFNNSQRDLLSFLPDADSIKRQLIRESLSNLDFKKRIPKILFTAEYSPDGKNHGTIVGWKKIHDASGYVIKRHGVFSNNDNIFSFSNQNISIHYNEIKNYVDKWILSFYEDLSPNLVYAYLDTSVKPDEVYMYKLQAYQLSSNDKGVIFSVPTVKSKLSFIQLNDIENELSLLSKNVPNSNILNLTSDDVNPYPSISRKIFGNEKFDWIIAAVNIRSLKEKGEKLEKIRSFSYLGSRFSDLKTESIAGNLLIPKNVDDVINNIRFSLLNFGISQTLLNIFDDTGMTFFFGDKESNDDFKFDRAGTEDLSEISTIANILATIDPETATINVNSLITNINSNLSSIRKDFSFSKKKGAYASDSRVNESNVPEEISINDEDEQADDITQFLSDINNDQNILDLTTFDGISSFIRILRAYFDFRPDRTIDSGIIGPSVTR